jgi:molybdenum cofactor cytidylyltransferase
MIPRRIGVLLAAGRSRRMGRTKQLVPWESAEGPKPLVAAAFDAICPVCDDMVVVVGHDSDAVLAALGTRLLHSTRSDPDAPMFDSIRAGLEAAQTLDPAAVVLLQPGDHPAVAVVTLHALTDWSLQRPVQAIVPEYEGRGGHPILIPPAVAKRVLEANCPNGLGQFWTAHPELCFRIPVSDQAVVRDIDTQADLDREASLP